MTDGSSDRCEIVRRAATAGGTVAKAAFRSAISVETKTTPTDYVTQADRDAQVRVIETIRSAFPEEPIVGEEDEAPKTVPTSGPAWIVDPIDGTTNFIAGDRTWTTSVAAVRDRVPIAAVSYAPVFGDTYAATTEGVIRNEESVSVSDRQRIQTFTVAPLLWWSEDRREEFTAVCRGIFEHCNDLRRIGSAQLTLAKVASGELDGAVTNVEGEPWDTVAGVHMIRAAGGTVTDPAGDRWQPDSTGLVASNGQNHDTLCRIARRANTIQE